MDAAEQAVSAVSATVNRRAKGDADEIPPVAAQGSHFFTLFAFALNNQHDATVYFFFGTSWRAPLVLVVLAAFAGGLVVGALGMLPGWWKHRGRGAAPGRTAGRRRR